MDNALPAGYVVDGRFRIEGLLGFGGMGEVYRATQTSLNRQVALKRLRCRSDDPVERAQEREQFEHEGRLLSSLSHPRLARVYDCFGDFLAMELIEGKTLEDVGGPQPPERVLKWAKEMMEALDYLHRQSPPIVVRDLKPANVMVKDSDAVCLIDFGIARQLNPGEHTRTVVQGVGSPGYAPLEQYGRSSTDQRSDLYSLGATLIFALTGVDPPPAHELASGQAALPAIRTLNSAVSEDLERTLLACLRSKPAERPRDVAELRRMLGMEQGAPVQTVRLPHAQVYAFGDWTVVDRERTTWIGYKGTGSFLEFDLLSAGSFVLGARGATARVFPDGRLALAATPAALPALPTNPQAPPEFERHHWRRKVSGHHLEMESLIWGWTVLLQPDHEQPALLQETTTRRLPLPTLAARAGQNLTDANAPKVDRAILLAPPSPPVAPTPQPAVAPQPPVAPPPRPAPTPPPESTRLASTPKPTVPPTPPNPTPVTAAPAPIPKPAVPPPPPSPSSTQPAADRLTARPVKAGGKTWSLPFALTKNEQKIFELFVAAEVLTEKRLRDKVGKRAPGLLQELIHKFGEHGLAPIREEGVQNHQTVWRFDATSLGGT